MRDIETIGGAIANGEQRPQDAIPGEMTIADPEQPDSLAPAGQEAIPAQLLETVAQGLKPLYTMLNGLFAAMEQMANLLTATNDNMEQIKQQLRTVEHVTPAQAQTLGKEIRDRANALLMQYGRDPGEKSNQAAARKVQGMIRRDLRINAGVEGKSLRDLPKCEYLVMMSRVALWDDYEKMLEVLQGA